MVDDIHPLVKEMLEVGAICPSQSPWCNAVVLVHKKDGGLHFCIDFCELNARTKKDSYQLPQMQEAISGSGVGAGYFSCLDLKAGFWQIAMDEASHQCTAFTMGKLRFFECKCMPFWLCNYPATFQRLMQNCPGELNLTCSLIYLDNMIVFSKMKEEHLQYLHIVSNHLRGHNLIIKATKCKFFHNEINWLADHISKEGVWPSKENLKAVSEFTLPHTYTEIWAFLGLVGHYWQFIKGIACIGQPLHKHLSGEGASKKIGEWHSCKRLWVPLRCLRRLASRHLCWLLLISISHFLQNWHKLVRIGSHAITKTDWWLIPSGSIHNPIFNCSWA